MTEDEARTKWCPAYRMNANLEGWNSNREGVDHQNGASLCIASKCMAWRVEQIVTEVEGNTTYSSGEAGGHCGLAGSL